MQKTKPKIPLSRIVTIPPKAYPSSNIEHDSITLLENYIPSASTLDIVERFSAGISGGKNGRMISVTGSYGSGKSTMAVFLRGLLAPAKSKEWKESHNILKKEPSQYADAILLARKKLGSHEKGMIRCAVMARRDPLSVTILRGLVNGFTDYFGNEHVGLPNQELFYSCCGMKNPRTEDIIKIIEDAAKVAPILIMIDEFGKNIEYFAAEESQQSDLFLLQELAERSRRSRKIPLSIITLQHMAFEEYAIGASIAQKKEWSKIQGRFDDIPFANSPEQTRQLVSNTIQLTKDDAYRKHVKKWANKESKAIRDIGLHTGSGPDLIASCYPLSPISLEVIPELCSRYGQRERTLLSFISDSKKHTVATFIDENHWDMRVPPAIGLDLLYDFFISGTSMIHSSSQNISRLMEVETIIRDAHGLNDAEKKTLKTIGILNLIGRSGTLRASRRMIDYSIGQNSQQILKTLEKRSMITYRTHVDEYRIWHGTDIDIAAKLEMYRSRFKRMSLFALLRMVITLEPVVAARHSIKNGTMRLFERRFTLESSDVIDENFDGVILYNADITASKITENTGDPKPHPYIVAPIAHEKPVITVTAGDTTDLKFAAVEVAAIRDILDSEEDIVKDWVARREFEERLADAEVVLDREFADAYGMSARWSYTKNEKAIVLEGTPSSVTSQVCDDAYCNASIIRNEMINRTNLSAQGSAAKKSLLEKMILYQDKLKFGIEGHGPDRAIYEAVFFENGLHVNDSSFGWRLDAPKGSMKPVWDAMLDKIKKFKSRLVLTEIYRVAKMPPYGVKDGPLQLIFLAMVLAHKENIALYEHGTFVPRLRPEIAERMTKNPDHFEIKYFRKSTANMAVLDSMAAHLKVTTGNSMLDVVSHLVRTVIALPPYVKSTKTLDRETTMVRDSIMTATEPDKLLFESLPHALGFDIKISHDKGEKFAKMLTKSINTLEKKFANMFEEISQQLFAATTIEGRQKLSEIARTIQPHVTDQKMKVFLGALSADVLEKDEDWINYIAMSLTDVPPTEWKDDQKMMFGNNLHEFASRFRRMASLHFSDVSDNFGKESYQITVTRADGSEHHNIVSLKPEKKKKLDKMVQKIKKEMRVNGFTDHDMSILDIMLGKKSD